MKKKTISKKELLCRRQLIKKLEQLQQEEDYQWKEIYSILNESSSKDPKAIKVFKRTGNGSIRLVNKIAAFVLNHKIPNLQDSEAFKKFQSIYCGNIQLEVKIILEEIVLENSTHLTALYIDEESIGKVEITPPLIAEKLDWYFESYLKEPYERPEKGDRCSKAIQTYGQSLYDQIFTKNNSTKIDARFKEIWKTFPLPHITIELRAKTTQFDNILWEALWNKESDAPLVALGTKIIRSLAGEDSSHFLTKEIDSLNVLIITARQPLGFDIDYQTVQRPIVELSEKAVIPVNIFLLRPGTFQAFRQHLQEKQGFYHIIHFDLHGAVMTMKELNNMKEQGAVIFMPEAFSPETYDLVRDGYGPLNKKSLNARSFLFFEDEASTKLVPYEAKELASFLKDQAVPICFLNACQSAKQPGHGEPNLGWNFIHSGLEMVIAMRQSISISSVEILVHKFYQQLFQKNHPIIRTLTAARSELFYQKKRNARFDMHIQLDDWIIPIIYTNRNTINLFVEIQKDLPAPKESASYEITASTDFTSKLVGRDLDIIRIEKILLSNKSSILNITGMIGVGKTTLLRHLAKWWMKTNFIHFSVRFDLKNKALSQQTLIERLSEESGLTPYEINHAEHGRIGVVFLLNIKTKIPTETIQFMEESRGLIFLMESITPLSIPGINFSQFHLQGLDEQSTFKLSRLVAEQNDIDYQSLIENKRTAITNLIGELSGNPSAIENTIPQLKDQSPEKIREELW